MTASINDFIDAMRQLAAGVTLVTTSDGQRRLGLTATAVCSVSAEPPQLLICVNRLAEAHDLLLETGVFAVNLLTCEQRPLADRFAGRGISTGEDKFKDGSWRRLGTGAPVLEDALASFDCRVTERMTAGTHTVFVGSVEAVTCRSGPLPMVYHDGDYGLVTRLDEA